MMAHDAACKSQKIQLEKTNFFNGEFKKGQPGGTIGFKIVLCSGCI